MLSPEEVERIINGTKNLKHRAILATTYSAGLRLSEVTRLKIADIDSPRMLIHVAQGKGSKDRNTLLSKQNLELLRVYFKAYRPKYWLFPSGWNPETPLHVRSIQNMFHQACRRAGITRDVSMHTLRHSFATHLMEKGIGIHQIQKLLGHRDVRTTTVYLHLSNGHLANIASPLESLNLKI